jgi:hypothetical protein
LPSPCRRRVSPANAELEDRRRCSVSAYRGQGDAISELTHEQSLIDAVDQARAAANGQDTVDRAAQASAETPSAREALMDYYAEQILVISFDESGDIVVDQAPDGRSKTVDNHAKVQRDRPLLLK